METIELRMSKLLHEISKEQGCEEYELEITPINTAGANYSSTLYVAKIISKNKPVIDLFIKISQIGPKIRESIKLTIFKAEKFVYNELKNIYRQIEETRKVPTEQRLYIVKYYGADTTPPDEMLVLENLAVKGYLLHDRFKSIDWEYASTAVIELTKFHSLSMAYQRDYPKEFKYFSENHQYEWLNDYTMNSLWVVGFKKAIDIAPEVHKEKLRKFFDRCDLEEILRQYGPLRCNVLTHGDFRPSNMMHRRRDDGSLEIVVVDHQTMQIGCPVTDLLYLIFTGTDKAFRDQHFDQLVLFYYTQLSEVMKRLGIDPDTTYSKADFDFEMKELVTQRFNNQKLPFGLAVAAFVLPIITVEAEHAPELGNDNDLSSFAIETTGAMYPSRMNGVIDDFVRWGILKD